MCNAWNHSSNCRCGWGGENHLGTYAPPRSISRAELINARFEYRSKHSYTVPNARCPACAASVYFYQSPHGGKVYFDELGGDWPKHPCTDLQRTHPTAKLAKPGSALNPNPTMPTAPKGWKSMVVNRVERHESAGYSKLRVDLNGEEVVLWVASCDLVEGAPFFYLDHGGDTYPIETVSVGKNGSVTKLGFLAYRRQMDFDASRQKHHSIQAPKISFRVAANRVKQPQSKRGRQHAQCSSQITDKAIQAPALKTSIVLAFEKAVQKAA